MFDKSKMFMQDHLKAFGVVAALPIIETEGNNVTCRMVDGAQSILIGTETVVEETPVIEWMIATGYALLQQQRSELAEMVFAAECESNNAFSAAADDVGYIADLAALYQCYLQNPVEAYCIYDDAIELNDEASLHPIAVALGLSHPRGPEAMGFDKHEHASVLAEAEFFKPVITQKHPDLSLLIALQNAWQKHKDTAVKLSLEAGTVHFSEV